jgi:hypothetical protein
VCWGAIMSWDDLLKSSVIGPAGSSAEDRHGGPGLRPRAWGSPPGFPVSIWWASGCSWTGLEACQISRVPKCEIARMR